MTHRRFPPPWSIKERDAGFCVRDSNGQELAYVYFDNPRARLSRSPAMRRIAVNIAKLPELLRNGQAGNQIMQWLREQPE
jgi:hypothetical protein